MATLTLTEILDRHREEPDHLSRQLVYWGDRAVRQEQQSQCLPKEQRKQIARGLVEELSGRVLIDAITRTPLQEPVRVREWTMNRQTHDDFQSRAIPFDGGLMGIETAPHPFAEKMIVLRNRASAVLAQQDGVQLIESGSAVMPTTDEGYLQLAQNAVAIQGQITTREKMRGMLSLMSVRARDSAEQTAQAVREAKARAREHEARLQEEIDSLKRTQDATVRILNGQLEELERTHQQNKTEIDRELVSERADKTALNARLIALEQTHQRDRAALAQRVQEVERQTQQQVAGLAEQLRTTQTTTQTAMTSMGETHARETDGLRVRLGEATTEIGQLDGRLRQAEARNAQNEAKLRQNEATIRSQAAQLQHLQDAVNDDDGCAIM